MSDISELFDRNPLNLTDQDLDKIISFMRQHQAQYELGVKTPPVGERVKKPKASDKLLNELGLGGSPTGTDLLKDLGL